MRYRRERGRARRERASRLSAPDGLLRPALDLAVAVARRGTTAQPPVDPPRPLRPFLAFRRLSGTAMRAVRQALEDDEPFRLRVRDEADEAALGRAAWLFLDRPDGWEDELAVLDAARSETAQERRGEVEERNTRRRLAAADEAARRAQEQLVAARTELAASEQALASERRARRDAESAREALKSRVGALESERNAAHRRVAAADAEIARLKAAEPDARPAEPPVQPAPPAQPARPFAARRSPPPGARRLPCALPPGLLETDPESADFLVRRPNVLLVVDGYNASLRRWPLLSIAEQRQRLLDALGGLGARTGAEVHVVFDGADDRGSSLVVARRAVRITFSPAGVEADEVIVDLVDSTPEARPVVVSTDDRRVQRNAAARGANVITQQQLFGLLG